MPALSPSAFGGRSSSKRRGLAAYVFRRPWLLLIGVVLWFVVHFSRSKAAQDALSTRLVDALREVEDLRRAKSELRHALEEARGDATTAQRQARQLKEERSAGRRKWLVIGMPSVPRAGDIDYLVPTLDSILDQLPGDASHPFYDSVRVVVVNMRPGEHKVFERARRLFAPDSRHRSKGQYVRFVDKKGDLETMPVNPEPDGVQPSPKVQQQTVDLVYMLRASLWAANDALGAFEGGEQTRRDRLPPPAPENFMFMEDDFLLCQNAWLALVHFIQRASAYHDWAALRVSYGLNGLVVKGRDVEAIAHYFRAGYQRRPPDHLASEWYLAETEEARRVVAGRRNMAFRYNLHRHIGVTSAIDNPEGRYNPPCFSPLGDWLFDSEIFQATQCPNDDVWPCHWQNHGASAANEAQPEPGEQPLAVLPNRPPEEVTGRRTGRRWPPPLINWVGGVCVVQYDDPPYIGQQERSPDSEDLELEREL
eukprot:tig00000842_g4851.t1